MTGAQRLAVLIVAVVVAVVGFVILQPEDEDESADNPPVATTTAGPEPATPTATVPSPSPTPPAPRVETIRTAGGRPVGGVLRLRYSTGDVIRLRVRSDVADHVHVHGYDKLVDVAPGKTASLRFTAELEGIFEVELEERGELLATLEVRP